MNKTEDLISALEAMLFAAGDPVEVSKLADVLEIDLELCENMLGTLCARYDERESGLMLVRLDNKYQLCTRETYSEQVRKLMEIKKNAPLSNAAFEVLAVIAYNKTVTRSFIEQVRGVDCSGPISSLVQKGLIEEKGRLDLPGRPLIYGTTDRFLRCFSLNSLEDLPELPKTEEFENLEEVEKITKDDNQTSLFDDKDKSDINKENEIAQIASEKED